MRNILHILILLFILTASSFGANTFDEISQYETVADGTGITLPDGDWTISLWLKTPDNTGTNFQYFFHSGTTSANPSFAIYITESSQGTPAVQDELRANVRDGDTGFLEIQSTNDYFASGAGHYNVWVNIILIRSGGGSSACTLTLYENGSNVGSGTDNTIDAADTSNGLFLGTRSDLNVDRFFGGSLAEVAKWDRALTAGEITTLQHYSPNCIPGRKYYVPMIRNYVEQTNNLTVTNHSSTVTDHPPLIYCN